MGYGARIFNEVITATVSLSLGWRCQVYPLASLKLQTYASSLGLGLDLASVARPTRVSF